MKKFKQNTRKVYPEQGEFQLLFRKRWKLPKTIPDTVTSQLIFEDDYDNPDY